MLCCTMHCQWGRKPPKLPFPLGFCNDAGGGPSHDHRQHAQKNLHVVPEISAQSDRWTNTHHTHTQMYSSQYSATANRSSGRSKNKQSNIGKSYSPLPRHDGRAKKRDSWHRNHSYLYCGFWQPSKCHEELFTNRETKSHDDKERGNDTQYETNTQHSQPQTNSCRLNQSQTHFSTNQTK